MIWIERNGQGEVFAIVLLSFHRQIIAGGPICVALNCYSPVFDIEDPKGEEGFETMAFGKRNEAEYISMRC